MTDGFSGLCCKAAAAATRRPACGNTERWRVPIDIEVISPAAVAAKRVPMV